MHYRSIVLELLQQRPRACERLKKQHMMLEAVNSFGSILKLNHEAIMQQMLEANPGSDPTQIKQAAFEIALSHLEEALPSESDQDGEESLSLDQAMAHLLKDSLPA